MENIHIARVIARERRKQGWMQSDMARFLGVSKAAVSKWETGQSYPDAALLPRLAALFSISLDELMDYRPVMPPEEIRTLYHRLAADFSARPFSEVMGECRLICKRYFSCFDLLYCMGILFLNHCGLAGDAAAASGIIEEARALAIRVKTRSDDPALVRQALHMEALCCMALGQPQEAVSLLEGIRAELTTPETLLALACRQTGDSARASQVLQISIYRHMLSLLESMTAYLEVSADSPAHFDETVKKAMILIAGFDLEHLHPGRLFNFYLSAAQGQMALGRRTEALEMLEKYAELAAGGIYPLKLHGDAYFDRMDQWLEEVSPLGNQAPRGEKNIREDMTKAVAEHPAFAAIRDEPRYQRLLRRLKENEGS